MLTHLAGEQSQLLGIAADARDLDACGRPRQRAGFGFCDRRENADRIRTAEERLRDRRPYRGTTQDDYS